MSKNSDIGVAYCPERVLPGKVIFELKNNMDIIGGITKNCSSKAAQFYKQFVSGECIIVSSSKMAEMSKLVENSFRDVNIAFANELSIICDNLGLDVTELIETQVYRSKHLSRSRRWRSLYRCRSMV